MEIYESQQKNIKLIIEYDGKDYCGWQIQKNAKSIQEVLTLAISKLTGENIKLIGASRTDAGVHAYGQVANFMTCSKIASDKFAYAINSFLPTDIVIKASSEVSQDFHSRFSAKGKKYLYLIHNAKQPSALYRNRAFHTPMKLNINNMIDITQYFIGTHDFSAFRSSGCTANSTIRTINSIKVSKKDEIIEIEVVGESFLYNMVRIIAGTILSVGTDKISQKDIKQIFESKDRRMAGKTLLASGLYLCEVYF